ncbi:mitochondrial large subunit ribosomal protein-domain-containing protein [Cunninghamella echinulata]|nr:mitochondrial large subunit ribosomal protein-domain-containing protein [Cunninghamella echinulata]
MLRSLTQTLNKRFYTTALNQANNKSYIVSRTSNHGLPVYSEIKNGGTQQLTIIRRIEGDVEALKDEIVTLFPDAPKNHIRINPTNNHILIKGLYVNEIKQWLANKGF